LPAFNARRLIRHVQADLDQLADNAMGEVRKAYAALLQPFFNAISERSSGIGQALAELDAFKPETAALTDVLSRAAFNAVLRGLTLDRSMPDTADNAGAVEYGPLPFDEARRFWANKRLIYKWSDIADATYAQAVAYGFKVAGITSASVLGMIKADLDAAVNGQVTVAEFVRQAGDKYGLGSKHAETVIRTNVQTAYAWGHYQQQTDPAVLAAFPIWAFDVVQDDRTSDICRPLAGKAYPATHPIWDSLYPPNHYNCRTTVVAMSADEAAANGFSIENTWPRDPDTGEYYMASRGFEMNIGRVPTLDKAVSES